MKGYYSLIRYSPNDKGCLYLEGKQAFFSSKQTVVFLFLLNYGVLRLLIYKSNIH